MFYFFCTRKPNFSNIKKIDYNDYWVNRKFEINKKLKEREEIILKWVPQGAKVIDLGCGNSLLPTKLKEKGCDITVADISPIVLAGYEKYGLEGKVINLEDIEAVKNIKKFDYIILSEVLEHTKNPEEIIEVLKSHADYLIITIPNSAFYRYRLHLFWSGRFFTQWVYHPSEHLRYWSHLDFLDWLSALNLKVVECRSSNGLTIGPIKLFNLFKNLFGHQICYLIKT
ncbi:MAG: methionine biosynthesis protein MetW [Patescibacteria group bacterium]|nr:methionine biosynthesis protein MetW [Patescibacteria group bacterium]